MHVFVDRGESAKFADRPQLLELLSYCKGREHSVELLLVWKVDRLARNVGDHFNIKATLMKQGVRVVSVTEPIDAKPEGRLLETILAGFAQFDNDVRAARTVQGMRRKLEEGIYPWRPPLGYKGTAQPGSKKQQPDQPDQPAFGILQEAWTKFATGGFTKADILRFLHRRGLKTRTGKQITSQFVDHLFDDPFYAGVLRDPWSGEELPGKHLPTVSRATFEEVRRIIAGRNRSIPHVAIRPEFPLRTFVRCPYCGHVLTGSFSRGRSKYYAYYHCYNRQCEIRANYTLEEVHNEFSGFLAGASTNKHAISHLKHYLRGISGLAAAQVERDLRSKETVQARVQEQMKELVKIRVEKLITDEEFQEQRALLAANIGSGNESVEVPDREKIESVLVDLDSVSGYLMNLADAWDRVVPQYQRWFQQIIMPAGYAVGEVGTAQKGRLLSFFRSALPVDTYLVPPACESWNHMANEIESLAHVFRESSMF